MRFLCVFSFCDTPKWKWHRLIGQSFEINKVTTTEYIAFH